MAIAKEISSQMAKKCIVARVVYTGERYGVDTSKKVSNFDDENDAGVEEEAKGDGPAAT